MSRGTIVIVAWNQREAAERCVKAVLENNSNEHIIFVDNCSSDGTREWLTEQTFDYVVFDEGIQEYGKVINTVLANFEIAENIVLLEPRCQVGKETLYRMFATLENAENVGVVSCRMNGGAPEQQIELAGQETLDEIEALIAHEEDYFVIGNMGHCYAMTKNLIHEVGDFANQLATMEGVMQDYQLRALQKGFQNKICRAACVYKWEDSIAANSLWKELESCDKKILKQKWNMNYFNVGTNLNLSALIKREPSEKFSVLEVGCDMGANLLGIKNVFPNCDIYGLEINRAAVAISENVLNIRYGNIEDENVPFEGKFDYILFGDVLEHLHNPQRTIEYCRSILKENGRILASIPNVMHISVMRQLLRGEFRYTDVGLLDKTHIHLFTAKEIARMFGQAGYELEDLSGVIYELTEEERRIEQALLVISTDVTPMMYETYQYTVVARVQ